MGRPDARALKKGALWTGVTIGGSRINASLGTASRYSCTAFLQSFALPGKEAHTTDDTAHHAGNVRPATDKLLRLPTAASADA